MKQLSLIITAFFTAIAAFGTAQIPDKLIYRGDTLPVFANPLESYFELTGNRALPDFSGCGSTACWRGYIAIWEIRNDSLFLRAITSCHPGCRTDIRNANLKKMFGTDTVPASWFTGTIIIPRGNLVSYVHMGYASVYESELHISFKKGLQTRKKAISNQKIIHKINLENQHRQIAENVRDTLFYRVSNYISWDTTHTAWYNLCDEKYILTYRRNGKLKKVWVDWEGETAREKLDDWWWNMTDDRKCRKIIKKTLKPLNISYAGLSGHKIKIPFEIFYDRDTGKLRFRR